MLGMRSCLQAITFGAALCCASCAMAFQADAGDTVVAIAPRSRPQPMDETKPLLRIDSSMVLVPVHVTTAVGATVNGLNRENFQILEDRSEQRISTFGMEDAPVSLGFLFDTSGSMRTKMTKAAEAAAALFRTSNPDDEFFLVEFNDRARLTVPFTRQSDDVYQQIARTHPNGRTTLVDALYIALGQMKKARHARKAIVILSDGGDNWSRHSAREIRTALLESDVQVYAMGIFDPEMKTTEERNGPRLLDELTEITGGRHYPVNDLEALPEISERIGHELRSQYMLGYYPTNESRDGKYRQVVVKLATPNARDFRTYYRRGYYAPAE
jgi:Ca-activated chloride channel family protein